MDLTPKQKLYLALTEQLAPLWQQDELLMEADPATWQLARQIDEFLLIHMENPKVGEEQFVRNINRLRALYVEPVALAGGVR